MKKISTFNSANPIFYNVLIRRRVIAKPFQQDIHKEYFVNLLRENAGLPLSVVAYSIHEQDVRLVIAANDQAKPTAAAYCRWLTETYFDEMYVNILPDTGAIFEKPVIKKLKPEQVIPVIHCIHRTTLAWKEIEYNGSSFNELAAKQLAEIPVNLYGDSGKNNPKHTIPMPTGAIVDNVFNSYWQYSKGQREGIANSGLIFELYPDFVPVTTGVEGGEQPKGWIPTKRVVKFKKLVKQIADANHIKLKRYPLEVLPTVFYEVMGQTGCTFDQVGDIFKLYGTDRERVIRDTVDFYWDNGNKCYQIVNAFRLSDFYIMEYLLESLTSKGYVYSVVKENFELGIM